MISLKIKAVILAGILMVGYLSATLFLAITIDKTHYSYKERVTSGSVTVIFTKDYSSLQLEKFANDIKKDHKWITGFSVFDSQQARDVVLKKYENVTGGEPVVSALKKNPETFIHPYVEFYHEDLEKFRGVQTVTLSLDSSGVYEVELVRMNGLDSFVNKSYAQSVLFERNFLTHYWNSLFLLPGYIEMKIDDRLAEYGYAEADCILIDYEYDLLCVNS